MGFQRPFVVPNVYGSTFQEILGLLIWEHTHSKAVKKKESSSYIKKIYKPRTKKNNKNASKQTIFLIERDKNGQLLVS